MASTAHFSSMAELGRMIRKARKAQQLTLADTAGLCGVSMRFLSELENGRDSCSIGRVIQVCQTLGIDLSATRRDGGDL